MDGIGRKERGHEMTIWKKSWFVTLIAVFCCSLWGSAGPFIKKGYALFAVDPQDTASILVFAGLRFTLAGILVLLVDWLLHPQKEWKIKPSSVLCLAIFQTTAQYIFYYLGLAHTSGVRAAIVNGTGALFALLCACYVFHTEKMTSSKLIGVISGFVGILIMNHFSFGLELGTILVLLSQVSAAISSCLINRFTQKEDPVQLSGAQFLLGGLLLIGIGLLHGGHSPHGPMSGWFVLIYLACLSAIAYTLWSLLLQSNPVSKISIFNSLIPVLGVFISAFLLHEYAQAFAWTTWVALLFVSGGILFVTIGKDKKVRKSV